MSDDTKDRDDPAHQTMPPELRPFAKPVPPQRLVAPEDEAEFKAAIGALRLLNGGPKADPFYVDPKNDPALAERKAPESERAYAPPTELPVAEATVRQAAPAKVVITDTGARPPSAITYECGEIDIRPFREAGEARRAAQKAEAEAKASAQAATEAPRAEGEGTQAAAASPWAKEAAPESARGSELPSSLRPPEVPAADRETTVSTRPRGPKPAGAPSPARWIPAAIVLAVVAAAIVIGVRALVTGAPENPVPGPSPTGTAVVPPTVSAVLAPVPKVSAQERDPAPPSSTSSVVATGGTHAPAVPRAVPRPASTEDPYDAAVKPIPAVTAKPTAGPVAPPPTPPAATTSLPAAPSPTQTAAGGTRVFGN